MFRKQTNPDDEILPPEQDADVVKAQHTLDRIAAEVAVAEGELKEAEVELSTAEDHAAEAIVAEQSPVSLTRDREAVALRRDGLRLLRKAQAVATQKHAGALTAAQAQHWGAQWRAYQQAVKAFDESLAVAYAAQTEAMRLWNAIGQPGTAPILNSALGVFPDHFHPFLMEHIVNMPPEQVRRGTVFAPPMRS